MKFYFLIVCAISILIFSNCGSDSKNPIQSQFITFSGVIDDNLNDTSIYSNFAPSFVSSNYSVFAYNIANLQDSYTASVSNKNFSIVLPAAGNYIFFAVSPTYSFKMIKPNISLSNNFDTINFKSTVIAQYIEQIYAFDTSLTAINSSLPNLINEANNVYENAIPNLKSDTTAEIDKSKAILIKTISAVLYDKINNNSNLLNEFVNDIKIDSVSLSIYADSFIKNYFQFNASDTLIINGHTYIAGDTTTVLSTTKISSIINSLQTLLKNITKKIYITTSVYGQVGAVAVVNLDNISNVVFNAALTSNDNDIKYYDGKLFILNRSEDNIQIIDATNYKTIKQYNIGGAYSNPHDIVFTSSSIAYVCFNSKNFIAKINPLTGDIYDTFSLLPFVASNDSDNNPEATRMQKLNNTLFILMQSLDTNNWWTPTGYSRIAVFDLTNDTWIDVDTATSGIQAIELNGDNPYENFYYSEKTGKLYIATIGNWFDKSLSKIEEVNPMTFQVRTLVNAGNTPDTNICTNLIMDVAVFSDTIGAFIQYKNWGDNILSFFNPASGEITDTDVLKSQTARQLKKLMYDSSGNLYVLEQTFGNDGLLKITPSKSIVGPINLYMPPNFMVIVE